MSLKVNPIVSHAAVQAVQAHPRLNEKAKSHSQPAHDVFQHSAKHK